MTDVLLFLTSLTLILIAGIFSIYISKKFKLPLPLVLFLIGFFLGNVYYYDRPIIDLSGNFLAAFSLIALSLVLFDSTSKIKFYAFDKSMQESLKFFIITLLLNLIVIVPAGREFFGLKLFSAIILALLLSCIEYLTIFPRHHVPKNGLTQFLKDESLLSCAFIVFMPFLIISTVNLLAANPKNTLFANIIIISTNIFAGIGAGIIISLIIFNLINKKYFEKIASYVLAAGLLLSYVVAQQIGGNGIVAVATVGFIFGNVFLRHKKIIVKQETALYSALEVFMFMIAGIIIGIPLAPKFLLAAFGIFVLYLIVRFVTSWILLKTHNFAERVEIAFFVPKGLATMTAAFALMNYSFMGIALLVQLIMTLFVYSLIFDTILDKFGLYKHR